MPRRARLTYPDIPHHVTQRGNRRAPIFFEDGDQHRYLRMLKAQADKFGVALWAYCLMPNHVHLVVVPSSTDGLSRALGEAHRQYAGLINARGGWSGHLFQDRFASVAMDDDHLINAIFYVSLNPVRAGLARQAKDWPWSSVQAHLMGRDSEYLRVAPILDRLPDFAERLASAERRQDELKPGFDRLRASERSGLPVGSKAFLARLEAESGRSLA